MALRTTRTRRWKKRLIVAIVVVFVAWAVVETGYEALDISAICPKCLQHAYIHEVRVHGICVYRTVRPRQHAGGIMSSTTFSPPIPRVSPALYEQILNEKCRHDYQYGGFGCSHGLLLPGAHEDGAYGQWRACQLRIDATKALYVAFARFQNRALAAETYHRIDTTVPSAPFGCLMEAVRFAQGNSKWTAAEFEQFSPEGAKLVQAIRDLIDLNGKLNALESEDEWEALLRDFDGA
jgi:hypothetical protein